MSETNSDVPNSTHERQQLPEWTILGAVWRWALPIALVTAVTGGVLWKLAEEEPPVYPVQTELLVRIGYEYSPVPWGTVSETQQINFRADEVIGTEIQIISGSSTIQKALQAAPHPEIKVETGNGLDATQIQIAREKLAVKRLEGSNVILVQVTDADPEWATAFLDALIGAYFAERARLFSQNTYGELLDKKEADAQLEMTALDDEARAISERIAQSSGFLLNSASALSASAAQPGIRVSLADQILALKVYVDGMEGMAGLKEALDTLDRTLAASDSPPSIETGVLPAVPTSGTLISGDLLREATDNLASDATRLNAIRLERDDLVQRIETIRTAQLRLDIRDEASDRMTVMTPPHQLAMANGLSRAQKPILGSLIGLILSALFFVYIDGLRRGTARRGEDA